MAVHMPFSTRLRADDPVGVPARVVPLSEQRAAIYFDLPASGVPRGARITATCDGVPFRGPVAVTRLGRTDGAERHMLLVASAAEHLCAASIRFESDGMALAGIDPLALQSPLVDPLALIAGLDDDGSFRLLRLLLTTGASLFGSGDLRGFGMIVGRLLESLTSPIPLSAWCPVGRGMGVLSWRLPAGTALPPLRNLCVLHDGRARRFTEFSAVEEDSGAERILHLLMSKPLPEGADLVVLGERPARLAGPDVQATRPLTGWLERRGPRVRARTLDWLDSLAASDARIAELRDELASPPGSEPKVGILHLSETPEGLLYLLSVEDPCGLLVALRVSAAGKTVDVPCNRVEWHPRDGNVVAGFARLTGRSGGAAEITPIYRSGRLYRTVMAVPGIFDGRVPEEFLELPEQLAAPALAEAIPAAMRRRPVWRRRVTQFGTRPTTPRIALVVAAGEAPEHMHALIGSLMAEKGGRRVDVVIHHGDGPASEVVRGTAKSLAAIHRVGIRVVSVASDAFASERLRAALAETRAPRVVVLGPGVLPARPGWLAAWNRRIGGAPQPRAVVAEVAGSEGAVREPGRAIGLNAAAVVRLMQTRPLLPGVGADLEATMELARARGVQAVAYQADHDDPLGGAAERLAVTRLTEVENG